MVKLRGMAKDLLIEIGTEDIPSRFIPGAMESLKGMLKEGFDSHNLGFKGIHTFGTPRRLGAWVEGVDERQADRMVEILGPAKRVAFDEKGNPTKAAEGFAKVQGVGVTDLKIVQTEKGEYICARKRIKGERTEVIMSDLLPKVITSIPFPKVMRWGDGDITFARPIHWVLALLGSSLIPFQVGRVKSGAISYGHRFLRPKPFRVKGVRDYLKRMEDSYVILDPEERRSLIEKGMEEVSMKVNGMVLKDEELLDEVINLVEYPVVLRGSFDKGFLSLPKEVVINAMREHQRYFSVVDTNGNLLPYFITISNTPAKDLDVVVKGNERVLMARLNDARFYFEKDIKIPLAERLEALKGVVFQSRLGTSYEKVQRFTRLAVYIGSKIGFCEAMGEGERVEDFLKVGIREGSPTNSEPRTPNPKFILGRSAMLCKADLTSGMVGEFPNLQGIVGREYALRSGEDPEVAKAIYEHYLPLSAGGELPSDLTGAIIGIADRMDTICGCFGVGLIPTGTTDPYALRRHALAIIAIILDKDFKVSIYDIVDTSLLYLRDKLTKPLHETRMGVLEFFKERLRHQLLSQGYSFDVVDAVLTAEWYDIVDTVKRVKALEGFKKDMAYPSLVIAFKRVSNILKGFEFKDERPDPLLLEDPAEKGLFNVAERIAPEMERCCGDGNYEKAFEGLTSLKGPIDTFFDKVMVIAEDEKVRRNRLLLLNYIRNLYRRIADLSKLII